MKVGFIGLGSMGLPMAQRLHGAGHQLTVHARRPASLEPFTGLDVSVAATPAALARQVEAIGICVFDAAGVEEVLFGPNGIATAAAPGTVVLVHSTVAPAQIRAIAERADGHGLRVLDAPVSGGAPRALTGELTVMIGGDATALADVADLLTAFASQVVHLGPTGAASTAKLINNTLLAAQIALADAALTAGHSLGVDPEGLRSVLLTSSSSCVGSGVRLHAGSLAAVADSPAGPTLAKDVTLMSDVLATAPGHELVEVAQRLVTALRTGEPAPPSPPS